MCHFTIVLVNLHFFLELVSAGRPHLAQDLEVVSSHDRRHVGDTFLDKEAFVLGDGGTFSLLAKRDPEKLAEIKPVYKYPDTQKILEGDIKLVDDFHQKEAPLNTLSGSVAKASTEYGDALDKLHRFQVTYDTALKASREYIAGQELSKAEETNDIMVDMGKEAVDMKEVKAEDKPSDPDVKELVEIRFSFTGDFSVNSGGFTEEAEVKQALGVALDRDIKTDPESKFLFCVAAETSLSAETKRKMPQRRVDELHNIVKEVADKKSITYEIGSRAEYNKMRAGTIIYKLYPKSKDKPECFDDDGTYIEENGKMIAHGMTNVGEKEMHFEE